MRNKKFDWNKRIGKGAKGNSDYVNPTIAWAVLGGVVVLAVVALIVLLSLI